MSWTPGTVAFPLEGNRESSPPKGGDRRGGFSSCDATAGSWAERLRSAEGDERTKTYHDYLRSPAWKAKREAALERADHRCQVCNASKRPQVHHRTYERIGAELPADLTVLCYRCHELFHGSAKLNSEKRRGKRHRRCEVCGRRWTTKGVCRPCKQGRQPKQRAKPKPCPGCGLRKTTKGLCGICRRKERQADAALAIRERKAQG